MQSLLPSSDSLTCHLVVEPVCQVRLKRFTWKEKSKEYLKSDLNLLSIGKLIVVVIVVEVDKVDNGAASLRCVDVDEDGLFCLV